MNNEKIYDYWMKSPDVSKELKSLMLQMSDSEIDVAFKDDILNFGTAGYRAIYGPGPMYLNEHTYQQLTVAYAKFLKQTITVKNKQEKIKVFLGHDNRRDCKKITELIANILSAFDIEVYLMSNNDMIATPIVSFIVRYLNLDGAINITASHNPKEYNGFKAYNSTGAQINEQEAKLISNLLPDAINNLSKKYIAKYELIKFLDSEILKQYYDSINQDINITNYHNFYEPIVITTHHGAGSIYVKPYLESLGHKIICVDAQCYEDPHFSNSPNMNPEDPQSFDLAIELANKINANIAIGFDPDADRMAVAIRHQNNWHFLSGNEMGILATYYLIKHKKDVVNKTPIVVSTYVSNDLVDRICDYYNGLVLRTATGFKNIAQAMDIINTNDSSYIVGFEEAVGMNISLATREKDGIAAAALVIEMFNFYKQQNQTLIDVLWNRIYQSFGQWFGKTVSIVIKNNHWKEIAQSLKDKALSISANTSLDNDFIIQEVIYNEEGDCIEWYLNNHSWIKFRISGTEPKFKIYFNLYFDNDAFEYDYDKYHQTVQNITNVIQKMLF